MGWLTKRRDKRRAIPQPGTPPTQVLRCMQCSYDLRGLAEEGRCPECGCAVADSRADAQGALPSETRRRLRRAALCLIALPAFATVGGLLFVPSMHRMEAGQAQPALITALWVVKGCELVGLLLALYGVFLVSKPPASGMPRDHGQLLRSLLRYGLLVAVLPPAAILLGLIPALAYNNILAYVFDLGGGAALLLLPPAVLVYFAVLLRQDRAAAAAARACTIAAVLLGLLGVSVVYAYVRDAVIIGVLPAPACFATIAPWMRFAGGTPLPILGFCYLAGHSETMVFIAIPVYVIATLALLRVYKAASEH